MAPSRSLVWDYFSKRGESITCTLCEKDIPNNKNTTNLKTHLKSRHPMFHTELLKKQKSQKWSLSAVSEDDVEFGENECSDAESGCSSQSQFGLSIESSTTNVNTPIASCSSSNFSANEPNDPLQNRPACRPTVSKVSTPRNSNKQPPLTHFTMTKQGQDKVTRALAYCVAIDMLPYSIVEKRGFKKFVETCNPSYKLPSRKNMTDKYIPDLFEHTQNIVMQFLKESINISLTTDCWTSTANQPFMGLTAHFIQESVEIKTVCLGCEELTEDHTSENIADMLHIMLGQYEIDRSKVVAITSDSGANVVKGVNDAGFVQISCFGHSINTAVNRALEHFTDVLNKIQNIQKFFAYSWKAVRELNKIQERLQVQKKKIPPYSKTRWWSLLYLIEVILQQEIVLHCFLKEYNKGIFQKLILTLEEATTLKIIVKVLVPIRAISDSLPGEDYVTASIVLPIYCNLKTQLDALEIESEDNLTDNTEEVKKTIVSNIVQVLETRYISNNVAFDHLQKCSIIDPRFKMDYIQDGHKNAILGELLNECENLDASTSVNNESVIKKPKCSLSAIFRSTRQNNNETYDSKREDDSYLNTPSLDIDGDPLQWWKANSINYPKLSVIAKKYLCTQGSSVPSERIFSKGGHIVNDHRASLTNEHASQLLFLAMNHKYVPTPR